MREVHLAFEPSLFIPTHSSYWVPCNGIKYLEFVADDHSFTHKTLDQKFLGYKDWGTKYPNEHLPYLTNAGETAKCQR